MNIKHRLKQFNPHTVALIENGQKYTYHNISQNMEIFRKERWKYGSLVSVTESLWFMRISKLFAILDSCCIAVPMVESRDPTLWNIKHAIYDDLKRRQVPGLVLFTSGSAGTPKVAVHDAGKLLSKWEIYDDRNWKPKANSKRTICLLDFDHIGGLNTLFSVLFCGNTLVIPALRDAVEVEKTIVKQKVAVLPTSPSFLKLLLLKSTSDFPDLEMITYGTEPMPETLLEAVAKRWPHVKLKQTYGLTETGILSTKSLYNGSLWLKIKEEHRVESGELYLKSGATMVGYLNSLSPIGTDGFYATGDRVEQDGEWLRIIGRKSEFINVGGNKVHPTEIEALLIGLNEIEDCTAEAEDNPILGQIIKLTVKPSGAQTLSEIREVIANHLTSQSTPRWKIPQKIVLTDKPLHNSRQKKVRATLCSHSEKSEPTN
jgi:acyl-coenzyme A synthetase/AMP-(fatty) acid ligase